MSARPPSECQLPICWYYGNMSCDVLATWAVLSLAHGDIWWHTFQHVNFSLDSQMSCHKICQHIPTLTPSNCVHDVLAVVKSRMPGSDGKSCRLTCCWYFHIRKTYPAGYAVNCDDTDGCHICFSEQENTTGENAHELNRSLLRVTRVFLPDLANRSMRALYHCYCGYLYAKIISSKQDSELYKQQY